MQHIACTMLTQASTIVFTLRCLQLGSLPRLFSGLITQQGFQYLGIHLNFVVYWPNYTALFIPDWILKHITQFTQPQNICNDTKAKIMLLILFHCPDSVVQSNVHFSRFLRCLDPRYFCVSILHTRDDC